MNYLKGSCLKLFERVRLKLFETIETIETIWNYWNYLKGSRSPQLSRKPAPSSADQASDPEAEKVQNLTNSPLFYFCHLPVLTPLHLSWTTVGLMGCTVLALTRSPSKISSTKILEILMVTHQNLQDIINISHWVVKPKTEHSIFLEEHGSLNDIGVRLGNLTRIFVQVVWLLRIRIFIFKLL